MSASAPPSWQGALATGYVAFASLAVVTLAVAGQVSAWFFDQIATASGEASPRWPLFSGVSAAAALAFAAPIMFFPRRMTALKAAGRAWTAGALLLGALGTLRAIPYLHHELYLAALALLAGGIAVAVRLAHPRRPEAARSVDVVWLGIAAGLAVLVPWLWLASLGGALETALAGLAATGCGTLAGSVLGERFWRPFVSRPRWQLVLAGGPVAGVTLALLAAGLGAGGVPVAALLAVPALGYAAAALQPRSAPASGTPVGAMVGVAAFGPLGFVDPEEMSLLLGLTDVPTWALLAALLSLATALLTGVAYGIVPRRRAAPTWLAGLLAAAVALAGLGVHAGVGHPGLHGDRIFVVLSSQTSFTAALPTWESATGPRARATRIERVYRQLVRHAERTQRPLRRTLDRLGLAHTPYYLVNGISVDAGPLAREWLSRRADVDRVLLDPVLRPIPVEPAEMPVAAADAPRGAPQWNVRMVGAPRVWSEHGVTGKGIVVGSSDSGVDGSHPALRAGFRGNHDPMKDSWLDPVNGSRKPTDFSGHGSHTTGSAVGSQGIGVAPGAQWIGCVNLARNMAGLSRYLDCLQFMLAPYPRGGDPFRDGTPARAPHVLNNSWGCPRLEGCDIRSLGPAVSAFRAAGIFFVASAGNSGPRCGSLTDPPARHQDAFTVAAVTKAGRVADFSSRGGPSSSPTPDIAAPGHQVLSAMPNGRYAKASGTSMAGPHVAGAVALLWSADPALIGDIDRTEHLLRETATPVAGQPGCGAAAAAGAGVVDAYAAVTAARASA